MAKDWGVKYTTCKPTSEEAEFFGFVKEMKVLFLVLLLGVLYYFSHVFVCVCVFFFRGRDLNLCFLGHMWMSFAVFLFDV